MKKKDIINVFQIKEQQANDFITDLKERQEALPSVLEEKERSILMQEALALYPSENIPDESGSEIISLVNIDNNPNDFSNYDVSATAVSGSLVTTRIAELHIENDQTTEYSNVVFTKINKFHDATNLPQKIRLKLSEFDDTLPDLFDDSLKTINSAITDLSDIREASLMMRNVLEHVKGILNKKCLAITGINNKKEPFTWTKMSKHLLSDEQKRKLFILASKDFKELHSDLSHYAKNKSSHSYENKLHLKQRYLDYLNSITSLNIII